MAHRKRKKVDNRKLKVLPTFRLRLVPVPLVDCE